MGNRSKSLAPAQTAEEKELIKFEAAEREKTLKNYLNVSGHRMPQTRREFLGSGVVGMLGYVAAPSILELVLRAGEAHAQGAPCPGETAGGGAPAGMIPFVSINLSGGWSGPYNCLVKDQAGAPLASYTTLGLGAGAPATTTEFGNVQFPTISRFLPGVKTGAGAGGGNVNAPTALVKTSFVLMSVQSGDDRDSNALSALGMVASAGLVGSQLPYLGSRAGTMIGQRPAVVAPPAPLVARNVDDVKNALKPVGTLSTLIPNQVPSLLGLVKNLSESQKARLAASSSQQTLGHLVGCATDKNVKLGASDANTLDARLNAQVAPIWGITAQTAINAAPAIQATMIMNALNGTAGAVGFDLGGYDYHQRGRALQDTQDNAAGLVVGRILRTAEVLNRPVFIHLTSDGGIACNSNTAGAQFTGDSGQRGTGYILYFNPAGETRPVTTSSQIGYYTAAQSAVDTGFVPGWGPATSAAAVAANYLQVNGKSSMIPTVTANAFSAADLPKVVKFG